jgi:hypothetical protein
MLPCFLVVVEDLLVFIVFIIASFFANRRHTVELRMHSLLQAIVNEMSQWSIDCHAFR